VNNVYFRTSPRIFVKIRSGPHGILRDTGETDSWKRNLKSKILCQTPFKVESFERIEGVFLTNPPVPLPVSVLQHSDFGSALTNYSSYQNLWQHLHYIKERPQLKLCAPLGNCLANCQQRCEVARDPIQYREQNPKARKQIGFMHLCWNF
jgi:hypothetical protein